MERLTKAALATAGAAALLVGGAGTLAFWTAQGTATGTGVTSGTLTLAAGACAEWTLDGGGEIAEAIVPGDTITTDCTMAIAGTGDHLGLSAITVTDPVWTGDAALVDALDLAVTGATLGGEELALPLTESVPLAGPGDLVVSVEAAFSEEAVNDTQGLAATLDDVVVQVTQDHVVPTTP
jgi:alternate signal-mediated exported protein